MIVRERRKAVSLDQFEFILGKENIREKEGGKGSVRVCAEGKSVCMRALGEEWGQSF